MNFFSSYITPARPGASDTVLVIRGGELLVEMRDGGVRIPPYRSLRTHAGFENAQYLGSCDKIHCIAGTLEADAPVPDGARFVPIRELAGTLDDGLFWTAVRAAHLVKWDLETRFCSACGEPVSWKTDERAKVCAACDRVTYPVISPAIITAVRRGDQLLLLNHRRSPTDRYSLLAGFVEPGESLEEAVARETFEEAGIRVRNICYFGSQPWGFTSSLMAGFTAEYESGDLVLQESEIRDAGWFRVSEFPTITRSLGRFAECSIAWRLIRDFEEKHGG